MKKRLAPQPRRAVAHLRGYESTSRLELAQIPDQPFLLQVVAIFPDRNHWTIQPEEGPVSARSDTYRLGGRLYAHRAAEKKSRELTGAEREAQLLRMEFRRALFLWPNGFAWEHAKDGAPQAVTTVHAPTPTGTKEVGTLRVDLDDAGRPTRIHSKGGKGSKERTLVVHAWREQGDRQWPHELELIQGGKTVWKETVTKITTKLSFLDKHFLPFDRRPGARRDGEVEPVHQTILPEAIRRVFPLPADTTWEAAQKEFAALLAQARKDLAPSGLEVEGAPTFRIDDRGRPQAAVLSLVYPPPPEPPDGWARVERSWGLLHVLPSITGVTAGEVQVLREALPPGYTAGTPYVRLWAEDRVQVTLPFAE